MIRNSPFHRTDGCFRFGARKFTFKNVVKQVMRDRLMNQFMIQMEKTLRNIVREELDRRLQPFLSSLERSPSSSVPYERSRLETRGPRYELRFINSLPPSIFTGGRIEAEDGSPIQIELVDAITNSRVSTGPLSSARVEVVALDGDFTAEIWDSDEFSRNILQQRQGKRPLITGDLTLTLKDGVGIVEGDVVFTDNSSWTRSRKFRLGVRAVRGGVMEGRSEPFVCKDQRGESYKKHYYPSPNDEVWRLEKIAKDGVFASRLAEQRILTVKDLRRKLAMNPNSLRDILGAGTSNKIWEAIVTHAMRCVLDETEFYTYTSLARADVLLLNSVFEVLKVSFQGEAFQNVDHLNYGEKVFLEEVKREAYENTSSFERVSEWAFFNPPPRSLPVSLAAPGSHHMDFQGNLMHFDVSGQPERMLSFEKYSGSSAPPTFQINDQFSHVISSALRNSFRAREPNNLQIAVTGQVENGENAEQSHVMTMMTWSPGSSSWEQQQYDNLYASRTDELGVCSGFDICVARIIGSPRARWCKIRAALKFREVYTAARNGRRGYKPY
ncbi:PREDICTED: calmodulin-binding protein 60 G-like [Tarenaya hassleriana]|uniref:calmodulin-binding protein 60 G-like n=1 Tax=Tarenaya hassleriana TaxID=28532 RepID=UPI00053C3E5D|nr:PREDICTED: calmodulin-binding protein 60 G-like [Tarenaya hassleriana]